MSEIPVHSTYTSHSRISLIIRITVIPICLDVFIWKFGASDCHRGFGASDRDSELGVEHGSFAGIASGIRYGSDAIHCAIEFLMGVPVCSQNNRADK